MILVETNIRVAIANSRDTHNEMARDLLEGIPDRLLVPATVIAEVCYLLSERGRRRCPMGDSSGPSGLASGSSQS